MADEFGCAQLVIVQEDVGHVVDVSSYASTATAQEGDKAAAWVHVEWTRVWKLFERASTSIGKIRSGRKQRISHNGNDRAIVADIGDCCPIQTPCEILSDPLVHVAAVDGGAKPAISTGRR